MTCPLAENPVTSSGMASASLLAALGPLLDHALELTPDERTAWLADVRARTPELARELETLLAAESELNARGFLAQNSAVTLAGPAPTLAGRRLGAYTLERPLGQGGMGTVWLAHRSDGRYEGRAAVKLLKLALLDPVGSERFRREGTAFASLAHPNIARLIDAGVTDEGQPFLVLEYVDGQRIDAYCDDRRLSPVERLALFQQVLAAVAHAHANLIVHRDLKPSNILVTRDGTVKLLDFGIAKLLEEGATGADASTLTDVGGKALTPEYAAPEQISGGPVTIATDVYSLGVLLYLLLAGRHPTGDGSRSAAEHLKAALDTEPPRLSAAATGGEARAASLDRLRRLYTGDLDNILAKALKKRPEERYATVGAFADDLRRFLSHEPVSARRDTLRYRVGKFVRRNRVGVAIGALATLALVGAAARERQLRGRAEAEARKAVAVEQYLLSVFGAADPFAPPESHPGEVTARALLDRGAERIDTVLANQPDIRGELRGALGRVYTNLGLYDRAAEQLRQSLEEQRSLHGPRHAAVAADMDQLGLVRFRQGQLDQADTLLRSALAQRRQLLGNENEATAQSLDHLAELLTDRADLASAERLLREALAIRRTLYGDSALAVATSKTNLARLLRLKGANDEAVGILREALATRQRRLGDEHPSTAETIHDLAVSEQFLGQYAVAESLYRRALAIQRKALGNAHPIVTESLNDLGQLLYRETPRVDEAEALIREALALNLRMFGENHVKVGYNLFHLAGIAMMKGDFAEAERLIKHSLAIDRALYGPEHTSVADDLNSLAFVYRVQGHPDSAVTALREALAMYHRLAPGNYDNQLIMIHLGRALWEQGLLAEAERLTRTAVSQLDSTNAEHRSVIVPGRVSLGRILTDAGRAAEALPLLESSLAASRDLFGAGHWQTAVAGLVLGECLTSLRQYARADSVLREAYATLADQRRRQPMYAAQADTALARLSRARRENEAKARTRGAARQ